MMQTLWIVTVKLPRNPEHDPKNKQSGVCKMSHQCTDVTGAHHSYLERAESLEILQETLESSGVHVTRIEKA